MLPSVDFAEEASGGRTHATILGRGWVVSILTIVTWCFSSTVRLNGRLETTVGSFRKRLRRLIPTSRDQLHRRPHFRSPPLITDLPGVLIRHASSDAERQAWGPCRAVANYIDLSAAPSSGERDISVVRDPPTPYVLVHLLTPSQHGLYVHQ